MPPEFGKQNANAKADKKDKDLGQRSSSEQVLKDCDALEEELAALKVAYEQYFLGNERNAPARAHEDFKKRLMKLKTGMVRNTAAKFRLNSLHNKFLTYERMWQRTLQEIEAGTYKRDLFKAKRRSQRSSSATASGEKRQEVHELMEEELSDDDLVEVAPIIPNEPKPSRPAFIPRPVDDDSPSFRPLPTATPVPIAPLAPVVPVVPTVASTGTPFRGTPSVAPAVPSVPSVPGVAPKVGTPVKGTAAVPPGSTPSKGTPTSPPIATPARGTAAVPPGSTPSKGTAAVPPGGTPSRGTPVVPPGGTPARGVPAFGAPSKGSSGIAAALESLTDEPLSGGPAASTARPAAPAARPGAAAPGARPGAPTAAKPATPAPRPPAAGGSSPGALSEDKLKAVYDAYVTAKRRNQEDTSKMSYETVAANLRKQVPELLKQSGAKSVEFKVVIKDGKATLKAVPK
ncbi:MAG TPA: MXAN_5187 C-terminal domain-containing protein [Myxococcaceae bacterium]|jgi:hypothetical protein